MKFRILQLMLTLTFLSPRIASCEWQSFGVTNGLPNGWVRDILEDRSGRLWVATFDGVAVLDANRTKWNRFPGVGSLGGISNLLFEGRDGSIWMNGYGLFRYHGESWTTSTVDLPQGQVGGIAQDSSGSIWVCGTPGMSDRLNRFDESGRATITAPFAVNAMIADREGNLWVGGSGLNGNVGRFDGSTWTTFTLGLAGGPILALLEDRNGGIWAGGGWSINPLIARFDGSQWENFNFTHGIVGSAVHVLMESRVGAIWAGGDGGLNRFDGVAWTGFTSADGIPLNENGQLEITNLYEDRRGRIWIGGFPPGDPVRYDGYRFERVAPPAGFPSTSGDVILEDRDGYLWIATDYSFSGLLRYDGAGWRTFTTNDGLASDVVWGLVEDGAGRIWAGSAASGITVYDKGAWSRFTTVDGLGSDSTVSLLLDRDGDVWAWHSGLGGGVSRYSNGSWTRYTVDDGLPSDAILTLSAGPSGTLWASAVEGLSRYNGTTWELVPVGSGELFIEQVLETRAGDLWVASRNNVSHFDGTSWTSYPIGTWAGGISRMIEDRSNRIWIAGYLGILRFNGAATDTITASELGGTGIYNLFEDRAGNIWVGMESMLLGSDKCAARFDGSQWTRYSIADGIGLDFIGFFLEDSHGDIWASGLAVHGRPRVARFDGSRWRSYPISEIAPSMYSLFILEDRTGSLWFGSDGAGVVRYEPDRLPPRTTFLSKPPHVSGNIGHSASFVAAMGERDVEFSYRLDGSPWSEWSPTGSWSNPGMSNGVHSLEARSRDAEGNVETTPAIAVFEIDASPPAPLLTSPSFGTAIRGTTVIRGQAADARFSSYRVETRPSGGDSWSGAALLVDSVTPVASGDLTAWDTASLADGLYDIRLTVSDSLGLTGAAQVTVLVDNAFPFADQTAPSVVSSVSGGDLYTNGAELHLFFAPHAFQDDALVSITTSAASDTLVSGAAQTSPDYVLSWSSPLSKAATLEFSMPASGTALAVYQSTDGSSWRRLGGTREPGKLSLAITQPGTYALFTDTAPVPDGVPTLSSLSFTPRVFSPTGTFAQDHLAIGFTLGRSSPVTVRVYNRAGRMIREVSSGETMGPGASLVRWDGKDHSGVAVTDGLYLVTVEAAGKTERRTVAVVR